MNNGRYPLLEITSKFSDENNFLEWSAIQKNVFV